MSDDTKKEHHQSSAVVAVSSCSEETNKTNETRQDNTTIDTTKKKKKQNNCRVQISMSKKHNGVDILERLGEIELALIKSLLDEKRTEAEMKNLSNRVLELMSQNSELREKNRKLEIHCDKLMNHLNRDQNRAKVEMKKMQACSSENEGLKEKLRDLTVKHEDKVGKLRRAEEELATQKQELDKVKRSFEREIKISKNLRSAIVSCNEKDATIESLQKDLAESSRRLSEFDQTKRDYLYFRARVRELEMEARERAFRKKNKRKRHY